jgi:hypothetical protein
MAHDDRFLSRWSRLKNEAKKPPAESAAPAPADPAAGATPSPAAPAVPAPEPVPPALPPVESLTSESDFAPFMRSEVDPSVKREALRTLFRDPRFNVMDGLDVYIDDYSKADPLPEGWLEKLSQVSHLGDRGEPAAEDGDTSSRDISSAGEPAPAAPAAPAMPPPQAGNAAEPRAPDEAPGTQSPSPGSNPS